MSRPPAKTALTGEIRIRVVADIAEITSASWDACANPEVLNQTADLLTQQPQPTHELPEKGHSPPCNPFVSHAFLAALESSLSATAKTGWLPQHLALETADGELLAAAPCYLKSHSRGEYVFDQGWAEAYEHAGGRYYPKLQVCVPFTPATGRRLLTRPGPPEKAAQDALAAGLVELCTLHRASSAHLTFLTAAEADLLARRGFLTRTDQQFHWLNEGYAAFDDFLTALASRKRKIVKRERRDALDNGITVHHLTGTDLTEDVWDAFFSFYIDTGSRKWGRPYLTRAFFSIVSETMRDRILLVMAKRNGRWIAGALNFIGSDTLYGRHWGAIEEHPFLHFELCYYQAIDYAIAHGLRCVEAGAQGEHKLARGYVPVTTHSAHYIADPGFRKAVADYLARERTYVDAAGKELAAMAPFRKTPA